MVKFPIQIVNGKVQTVSIYKEQIEQSLLNRLLTSMGTTFFDRDFGALVKQSLFESIDALAITRLKVWAKDALKQETRITVNRIQVDTTRANERVVVLQVFYKIIQTGENTSLNVTL